jgi:dienelactone hydrolase
MSGALPVAMLGALGWPTGLPAQIHYTIGDPRRRQEWLDQLVAEIQSAGADIEIFDYPGAGHLFTDATLPDEYDEPATELLWTRVLAFCESTCVPSG